MREVDVTFCMHPSRVSVALVACSSTSDVSGTYRTGRLGSRAWIWMYLAPSEAGVGFGPIVIVAALWSKSGSVQPQQTDPR